MTKKKNIVILGAGITGLSIAHWLKKVGISCKILELSHEVGGSMQTEKIEDFLIDYGPNSGLETTPLIKTIVSDINFTDEMIYANSSSAKRYILKNEKLLPLPTGPFQFLTAKLFSPKAKFRLALEPFIGKSEDGYYQSIAEFVERRLGKEFLKYAIDPFVSGVFAGDPHKLSVKSAFPKLYRLEEVYGGLIKGMIKGAKERKARGEDSKQNAKMFSFKNGMQSFTRAIARNLNGGIELSAKVIRVTESTEEFTKGQFKVEFLKNEKRETIFADKVISTIPAYQAAEVFREMDSNLRTHLLNIYYPPVMVLYLAFQKKNILQPLDGFGYLIPSAEKKKYLGAIWSSTIFPNRANNDNAAFTIFVGGAKNSNFFEQHHLQYIEDIIADFKSTMKITAEPLLVKHKLWQSAIPQYNLGYIEHENYFINFEKNHPGIFLAGNYRGGISVGDCIKNSKKIFDDVTLTLK